MPGRNFPFAPYPSEDRVKNGGAFISPCQILDTPRWISHPHPPLLPSLMTATGTKAKFPFDTIPEAPVTSPARVKSPLLFVFPFPQSPLTRPFRPEILKQPASPGQILVPP